MTHASSAGETGEPTGFCPECLVAVQDSDKICPRCGQKLGTPDPLVGRILGEEYELLERIAEGGMSVVYRARELSDDGVVAVKLLGQKLVGDPAAEERFLRECETAQKIEHANAVRVLGWGRCDDGRPYLVMEYLRGRSLATVIEREAPLPEARVVRLMKQIVGAMAEAHRLGFIHRDLKPSNIMIVPAHAGTEERAVVLDFGIAIPVARSGPESGAAPDHLGTAAYAAPEQAEGEPLGAGTDVYCLGLVMFQMLTGHHPLEASEENGEESFGGETRNRQGVGVVSERAPVEVSREMRNLVTRAFRADPHQRQHDARELLHELTRIEIEPPAPGHVVRAPQGKRGSRTLLIALAILLALLLFILVGRFLGALSI